MTGDRLRDDLTRVLLESAVDRLIEAGALDEGRIADELIAGGLRADRATILDQLRGQRRQRYAALDPALRGGPHDGHPDRATDPMAEVYRHLAAARRLELASLSDSGPRDAPTDAPPLPRPR